jgi:hypothetical protein
MHTHESVHRIYVPQLPPVVRKVGGGVPAEVVYAAPHLFFGGVMVNYCVCFFWGGGRCSFGLHMHIWILCLDPPPHGSRES